MLVASPHNIACSRTTQHRAGLGCRREQLAVVVQNNCGNGGFMFIFIWVINSNLVQEYVFTACATGVVYKWMLDAQLQSDEYKVCYPCHDGDGVL